MKTKELANLYRFYQVVEHGGFAAASYTSGISAPTLSRAVAELENVCGEKLLYRNAKQFCLTSAGESYYQKFVPLFKNFEAYWLDANNAQSELSGDIHLSCSVPFVESFLQNHVIKFMQENHKINVFLHYTHNTRHFVNDKIDISIVNAPIKEPYLTQRKLFEVSLGLAASPAYINKQGSLNYIDELYKHDLLFSGSASCPFWQLEQNGVVYKIQVKPKYYIDNFNSICKAAIAGLGICLMPLPILHILEQEGRLIQILKDVKCEKNKTYVVRSNNKYNSVRVSAFYDSLFLNKENINNGKEHFFKNYARKML